MGVLFKLTSSLCSEIIDSAILVDKWPAISQWAYIVFCLSVSHNLSFPGQKRNPLTAAPKLFLHHSAEIIIQLFFTLSPPASHRVRVTFSSSSFFSTMNKDMQIWVGTISEIFGGRHRNRLSVPLLCFPKFWFVLRPSSWLFFTPCVDVSLAITHCTVPCQGWMAGLTVGFIWYSTDYTPCTLQFVVACVAARAPTECRCWRRRGGGINGCTFWCFVKTTYSPMPSLPLILCKSLVKYPELLPFLFAAAPHAHEGKDWSVMKGLSSHLSGYCGNRDKSQISVAVV